MAAGVAAGLLPETQGVQFTARPVLRTRESIALRTSSRNGRFSAMRGEYPAKANGGVAAMSSIEIEAQIREKVRLQYDSIKRTFQTYDVDQNLSITKGEFRRVLESFCLSLTSEQFDSLIAKVDRNPNGTVRYCDFLDKFYGSTNKHHSFAHQQTTKEINMDVVEKMIRDKVGSNLKSVIKAMQLFDYNMDGKIQRHELRRVLENFSFKFTDQQFDKLWQRYDFHHTGTVNYREFLQRLGAVTQRPGQPPADTARGAMMWPVVANPDKISGALEMKVRSQQQQDQQMMKHMNFTQIEHEFRKRMKTNYVNLKRAFLSFDKHQDGFVTLEDLKSILSNFTLPMTDQLFNQLMERCGQKGSHRISWEAFLEKFQDPWMVGNGQTVPIKPSHKFFPIMETQKMMEADDVWHQLYHHVQSCYSSFKAAFLEFDKNRDGRITRSEFRRILEKFSFRLEEQQFKKLMMVLDPRHTNNISYHRFLDMFEEKETKEGHKWLKSCHRFNEHQKPVILAWETIEELLQEKITEHWKSVAGAIMYYDYKSEGVISPAKMKRIIDDYVLPISQEHFDHLLKRCAVHSDGRISYVEFLTRLNVDITPGDLAGVSTQITEGSQLAESLRLQQQREKQTLIDVHALNRTQTMSADEVIARLKDRFSQHHAAVRKAFINLDKRGKGLVSKRVFREVLATFGMLMTDEQFNVLVSRLDFHKGFMKYTDFLTSFEDPRPGVSEPDILRQDNHHVNPIRGDEYGMSALEVESKLRAKLRENFANLRGAFYKFDDNHNGILTKENFRHMLDSFMFVMTDEEYQKLCSRMGIMKNSRISYHEFLDRFEMRDTEEGHKWLNSVHMYNSTFPPRGLTAEEAHYHLRTKVFQQWPDIAKAFITIDKKTGKGVIRRQHMRDLLYKFVMPMTNEEFRRLWARIDEDNKGYISYQDFLDKLAASEFTPVDQGPSMEIIAHSKQFLEDHNREQQLKHEEITQKQAVLAQGMTAEWIERQLRDMIRDHYSDFYAAFRKYDTHKRGWLTSSEIQQVLVDLNFFISEEEFCRLLDRLGLYTDRTRLDYFMFLRAFEDGRRSAYGKKPKDVRVEEHQNLSPQDADVKLREKLKSQGDALTRALAAFDKEEKGLIRAQDFRRVLDLFCFKMSDPQWKYISNKLHSSDGFINYHNFMQQYSVSQQEDGERWMDILQDAVKSGRPSGLVTVDELQEHLQEAITSHYYNIKRSFAEQDYASIGVVTKEDFREVLQKHVLRLTDEQFDRLWSILPVNEFGNINYEEFLRQYSGDGDAPPLPLPPGEPQPPPGPRPASTRPHTSASVRVPSRFDQPRPATMQSRAMSRMSTPLVNADMAERRLKEVVFKNWKEIQKQCRSTDSSNTGTINIHDFREIMGGFGIEMPPDDFRRIVTKFDLQENGTFSYAEFLRHFIINLRSRENTSVLSRKKLHPPKMKRLQENGVTSDAFYDALLRLRSCVTQNWKEMRRVFRKLDDRALGVVDTVEFRKVLRQFNVNLNEDEFFHIMSYYDKNMDGRISYNEFLRGYLDP